MPVNVLWVVKGLGPGGAERLLVAAARAHDASEFTIRCAYVLPWKDHLASDLEAAGVVSHCVSRSRRDWRWPVALWKFVRSGGYDIVHVHSPLPGSVARLAARSMRRDVRPVLLSTEHNRWQTHRPATRLANRLTSRFDAASFAVTDEVKSSMRGKVVGRTEVLRHGIDIEAVRDNLGERSAVRSELGIDDDVIVAGTVANFRPQKDYPNLLRAMRLLQERGVPVRLVAVGQGPEEAEVRALHSDLELGDRVILTGFRDDAVRILAACDLFTMASQWEGLPVAVMEALALGLPIVATAVGGIAEEFDDDIDAVLVPPRDPMRLADAIERVAHDAALRDRLASTSRRRSSEFDVARTIAAIEGTYRRLCPNDRHPVEVPQARSSSRPRGPEVRAATPEDRAEILTLLGRSLGADTSEPRYAELFAWKHDRNRFGPSPVWVASEAGRIVAVRAFMRWEFERGGRRLRAVRAVDTATDPDHQGRGLFTLLTMHGLQEMQADGIDFVFNTPNDQSRPGYLKMGWREVGHLPAAVRFVGPTGAIRALRSRTPAERWSEEIDIGERTEDWLGRGGPAGRRSAPLDVREIRTRADDEYLNWRFGGDLLHYRVIDDGETAVIVRARRRGTALELAHVAAFGSGAAADRLAAEAARQVGADYVIRIGQPHMSSRSIALPGGGPVLTWRAANDLGMPPLANWSLELGDVELF